MKSLKNGSALLCMDILKKRRKKNNQKACRLLDRLYYLGQRGVSLSHDRLLTSHFLFLLLDHFLNHVTADRTILIRG